MTTEKLIIGFGLLPILGLDAQPVGVGALGGPEADAREGWKRLQAASDDGLLTVTWQDDTEQKCFTTKLV